MKKNKGKDIVYYVLMFVFAVIFLGSGGMLLRNYLVDKQHADDFEELNAMFEDEAGTNLLRDVIASQKQQNEASSDSEAAASDDPVTDEDLEALWMKISPQEWKEYWESAAANRFETYQSLLAKNSDFVGWIRIEGTRIDYPVLQSLYQADFYLKRDFNKNSSNCGIPYMMESCRIDEPRTNWVIYGHHMRNGSMFASLQNYTSKNYYKQHPYVQFDTIDQAGTYEVVGLIKIDAAGDQSLWQNLLFPQSEEQFNQAIGRFKQQTFYDTGISITAEDHLLALVTCEYTLKDGRLMLLAREVS